MTLEQFRATRREVSPAEFAADENRPVDLEFYPGARLHRYGLYYIIESRGEFHYTFMHPADDVAPTLADAERELHSFIAAESSP